MNDRVLEPLLHSAVADVGEDSIACIECQVEQSRSTIVCMSDPQLSTEIPDRLIELGPVMQFYVINAETNIIQQV